MSGKKMEWNCKYGQVSGECPSKDKKEQKIIKTYGLEDGELATNVASGDDTGTSDQTSTHVGNNVTIQVGHDHDIELLGSGDKLHGGVVDNHVVKLDSRAGVLLGDLATGVEEETISQLHDVGLVDAGDLLSVVAESKVKGETRNALRLGAGDDLERLDNAGVGLVLETRVLSLSVLTDDGKVNVLVAGGVSGNVLAEDQGGVHVQVLTDGDVEGGVAEGGNRGVKNSLETDLVTTQGLDRLLEGQVIGRGVSRDVKLLPVNRHLGRLEDGLDGRGSLLTNTITGNQGDGVATSKLRVGDLQNDRRVYGSALLVLLKVNIFPGYCLSRPAPSVLSSVQENRNDRLSQLCPDCGKFDPTYILNLRDNGVGAHSTGTHLIQSTQ